MLITDFLLSRPVALALSAVAAAWFVTLWVVLPFAPRNWGDEDPDEALSSDEARASVRADTDQ